VRGLGVNRGPIGPESRNKNTGSINSSSSSGINNQMMDRSARPSVQDRLAEGQGLDFGGASRSSLANQRLEAEDEMSSMRLSLGKKIPMRWDSKQESLKCLISSSGKIVHFHPDCSEGTVACMTEEPLRRDPLNRYYYLEIKILDKAYGTSVMFGLCTKRQRLQSPNYCNLIGSDNQGWSLSHKGLIWHSGSERPYSSHFPLNRPIKLGLLYNTMTGKLSYFMDGKNLGVAFIGLNEINEDLYPCVGSTAKNTVVVLLGAYNGTETLLDRCFAQLFKTDLMRKQLQMDQSKNRFIDYLENNLRLPANLLEHIKNLAKRYREDYDCNGGELDADGDLIPASVRASWRNFYHSTGGNNSNNNNNNTNQTNSNNDNNSNNIAIQANRILGPPTVFELYDV